MVMSIFDVVEQTKEDVALKKEVSESYDRTINEKGINVDTLFCDLLKEKNLWKHMK